MARKRLFIYSAAHFAVDFSCALLLLGRIRPGPGDALLCLLLYNFCAFALQMPVGLLADRLDKNHAVAAVGCGACALAWLIPGLGGAVCAGVGNALFHVGGGLDTLNRSASRCGALGIFVSPGALGIFLGGLLAGYAMCDGVEYGTHMGYGYKRAELREDDRLYIVDAQSAVHGDTTDAAEFWPAMIIDGVRVVDENSGWDALNPRVSIGQSDRGEILMMVTEGRLATSVGATVTECADILLEHNCMQALNMDGGTSAMMYYDGEYITRCSNQALPYGRQVPDAWVYARAS